MIQHTQHNDLFNFTAMKHKPVLTCNCIPPSYRVYEANQFFSIRTLHSVPTALPCVVAESPNLYPLDHFSTALRL